MAKKRKPDPRHRASGAFHVMAKPGGAACNLACAYCFYLSKEDLAAGPGIGRMADETLERFIKQYIDGHDGSEVIFSWQGGEPTLCGLDFFRRVVDLQKKHQKPGQRIENDLQTNGVLLNEDWVAFLKANHFLVGLSIDGPRELHDKLRVNKGGAPTFDKVMAAAELMRHAGLAFNTLTCVNRYNAKFPREVYRFLRQELGSTRIQFIPVVQHKAFTTTGPAGWDPSRLPMLGSPQARPGHPDSIVTDWSVDPDDYGDFLSGVFDEWLSKDLGIVYVNHIETLVVQHVGLPPQTCIYAERCGRGVAIEHDGSVYSCDHFVYPQYRLGTIAERPLAELVASRPQQRFGQEKSTALPRYCRACRHLRDCWGECPKNRLLRTPDGEVGLNYLCAGLKKYFDHAMPEIEKLAAQIRYYERMRALEQRARTWEPVS